PWLLSGFGAWMLWHQDGRHHHKRRHAARAAWYTQTDSAPAQQPVQPSHKAARVSARKARRSELPIDVQVKVEQIRRKVDVLLGYADRFPPFSKDLYLVRQTASDYLPRTIQAFLALPAEAASALHELKAQLALLDAKLDEI